MKFVYVFAVAVLLTGTADAVMILHSADYTSLMSLPETEICDCIPFRIDSLKILCTVLNSFHGGNNAGDTISIPRSLYFANLRVEPDDTLLVFADSSEGFLYGPHRNGFTRLSGDILSKKFNILSDDDLAEIVAGEIPDERLLEFEITVLFPLSEDKLTFTLAVNESHEFIEFLAGYPFTDYPPQLSELYEFPLVDIPELGLYSARARTNTSSDRDSPMPFRCQFYPVNEDEDDYERIPFSLSGNVVSCVDGKYHVNCFHSFKLTKDDLALFTRSDDHSGLLQVEIEGSEYSDSLPERAYIALTNNILWSQLHWIELPGFSVIHLFGDNENWNSLHFKPDSCRGNSLQNCEEFLSFRIPDEPVDEIRSAMYNLFRLTRDSTLTTDLFKVNAETGDSCRAARLRIHSYTPEYRLEVYRNSVNVMTDLAGNLLSRCISYPDSTRQWSETFVREPGLFSETTAGGSDKSQLTLRYDQWGNASLKTAGMTFREIQVPLVQTWVDTYPMYLLMEAQNGARRYVLLMVFRTAESSRWWLNRASAYKMLLNELSGESLFGTVYITASSCDFCLDEDRFPLDTVHFALPLNSHKSSFVQ